MSALKWQYETLAGGDMRIAIPGADAVTLTADTIRQLPMELILSADASPAFLAVYTLQLHGVHEALLASEMQRDKRHMKKFLTELGTSLLASHTTQTMLEDGAFATMAEGYVQEQSPEIAGAVAATFAEKAPTGTTTPAAALKNKRGGSHTR